MEPYDILRSRIVMTSAGEVEISVALQPGGGVSAIAWLREHGRRIGWLRSGTWARLPQAILIDTTVAAPDLAATMRLVIVEALEHLPRPALPSGIMRSSPIQEREIQDPRAFQWLLDELGEHYELDELAARARQDDDVVLASEPAGVRPRPATTPTAVAVWNDASTLGSAYA